MESSRKQKILEILEYWKTIEFLDQADIVTLSADENDAVKKLKEGRPLDRKVGHVFSRRPLNSLEPDVEKIIEEENESFGEFQYPGNEVFFCFGNILRNDMVEHLSHYVEQREELPEPAYPKNSAIACFSFKTDTKGQYVQGSIALSPMLWAEQCWKRNNEEKAERFSLNTSEYEKLMDELDDELQERIVSDFLPLLYERLQKEYVSRISVPERGEPANYITYCRYRNPKEREDDTEPKDFANLGKSFYVKDLALVKEAYAAGDFGDDNDPYEKNVSDYILSAYDQAYQGERSGRFIISPREDRKRMRMFFEKCFAVERSPLGKWPAKFMPAFMQQMAVNLQIDETEGMPIFSVNGPPGTGKTTLLKEIVAHNIVKRAVLLAEEAKEDPDDAFERRTFEYGPIETKGHAYFQFAPYYFVLKNDKVNDYGMIVTSCNNAAVENITTDLPKAGDLLGAVKIDKNDCEEVAKGLDEISKLFTIDLSEDIDEVKEFDPASKKSIDKKYSDIFFTRYANRLLSRDDCWGLVSAPLGKKSNINAYCNQVLNPIYEDYKSNELLQTHKLRYKQVRRKFLAQLTIVKELRKELQEFSTCANLTSEKKSRSVLSFFRNAETGEEDGKLKEYAEKYACGNKIPAVIDENFMSAYVSPDEGASTKAQVTNPWFTEKYNREREKLFFLALKLHKEFVTGSKSMRYNIANIMISWNRFKDCDERMDPRDKLTAFPCLFQSLFLLTPVMSSTFASMQTLMKDVQRKKVFGLLIVDESGQAQPQMSIGSLFRCRKAMIVGDPKQIEPVVTAESDMYKWLLRSDVTKPYMNKKISVQGFADYINPYGTYLGNEEEREWVGCPLVVHRRCIDPMYTISNEISYDGTMKQQTGAPGKDKEKGFILERSVWIDVKGEEASGNKNHFVPAQGEVVLKLLSEKFQKEEGIPKLFIITPFTSVKDGITEMIRESELYKSEPRVKEWMKGRSIGTVHTFQGQGTDEVIFLLGCDRTAQGAAKWVNKNIVNVAATRAKFRFYEIGDKELWQVCNPVNMSRILIHDEIAADELDEMLRPKEAETDAIDYAKITYKCPNCEKTIRKSSYGWYCTGKCGISFSIFGEKLNDREVHELMNGRPIEFAAKNCRVLPEIYENNKGGKTYFNFRTE